MPLPSSAGSSSLFLVRKKASKQCSVGGGLLASSVSFHRQCCLFRASKSPIGNDESVEHVEIFPHDKQRIENPIKNRPRNQSPSRPPPPLHRRIHHRTTACARPPRAGCWPAASRPLAWRRCRAVGARLKLPLLHCDRGAARQLLATAGRRAGSSNRGVRQRRRRRWRRRCRPSTDAASLRKRPKAAGAARAEATSMALSPSWAASSTRS